MPRRKRINPDLLDRILSENRRALEDRYTRMETEYRKDMESERRLMTERYTMLEREIMDLRAERHHTLEERMMVIERQTAPASVNRRRFLTTGVAGLAIGGLAVAGAA